MTSKLKVQPQVYTLLGRDHKRYEFTGVILGSSTSRTPGHTHPSNEYARKGDKCSACRWFEVYIYQRSFTVPQLGQDYVVQTVGGSSVPSEKRFSRVEFTDSPYDVIELLTVRPVDRDPFIAAQSARALAQAADLDEGIRDAYINRAVV